MCSHLCNTLQLYWRGRIQGKVCWRDAVNGCNKVFINLSCLLGKGHLENWLASKCIKHIRLQKTFFIFRASIRSNKYVVSVRKEVESWLDGFNQWWQIWWGVPWIEDDIKAKWQEIELEKGAASVGYGAGWIGLLPWLWGRKWCLKGEVGRESLFLEPTLLLQRDEQSFCMPVSASAAGRVWDRGGEPQRQANKEKEDIHPKRGIKRWATK